MPLAEWIDLLRCPHEGSMLRVQNSTDWPHKPVDLQEILQCETCQRNFAVIDGIVQFVNPSGGPELDHDFKRNEMKARDAAAEGYLERNASLRSRMEIPPCLSAIQPGMDDVVADLGCGTGRLTLRYIPEVSKTIAVDFSLKSLQVLQRQIPKGLKNKVLLVRADICSPPLAKHIFTKVVSFQVFEHLPTEELRQRAAERAAELLAPGGTFTITVYNWSKRKRREAVRGIGDNNLKEGFHDTNIYYYNFEDHEVRELLQRAGLKVEMIRGLIIPIRGARVLGRMVLPLNRLLAATKIGLRSGELLLARGRNYSNIVNNTSENGLSGEHLSPN